MRKIVKYSLFLAIALFLFFAFPTLSKKVNNHQNVQIEHNENDQFLQVERGEYSKDILDYIENNWRNFFGDDEIKAYAGSDILVGQPYGVYNIDEKKMVATKFPIYAKGKCVQVLDVFEHDGKLTWSSSITEDFLEQIDELRQKKGKYRFETKDNPNGGAPSFDIVKVDKSLQRKNQNALYSDINKPILKIKVN